VSNGIVAPFEAVELSELPTEPKNMPVLVCRGWIYRVGVPVITIIGGLFLIAQAVFFSNEWDLVSKAISVGLVTLVTMGLVRGFGFSENFIMAADDIGLYFKLKGNGSSKYFMLPWQYIWLITLKENQLEVTTLLPVSTTPLSPILNGYWYWEAEVAVPCMRFYLSFEFNAYSIVEKANSLRVRCRLPEPHKN